MGVELEKPTTTATDDQKVGQTPVDTEKSVEYWTDCYVDDNLFWHIDSENPILVDHLGRLTGGEKKKFFLPLAGKSLDLPYLVKQGHQVFAVEAVAKAIEELNEENNLGLKFDANESIYYTEDRNLIIYCGDFFQCPIEKWGPFDCVWDRGSFIAIDYELRPAYKKMMQRSLKLEDEEGKQKFHEFRYLLETVNYDRTKFDGPPRAVSGEEMAEFFGDWTNFEVVGGQVHPDCERIVQKQPNIGREADQIVYFIVPK